MDLIFIVEAPGSNGSTLFASNGIICPLSPRVIKIDSPGDRIWFELIRSVVLGKELHSYDGKNIDNDNQNERKISQGTDRADNYTQ